MKKSNFIIKEWCGEYFFQDFVDSESDGVLYTREEKKAHEFSSLNEACQAMRKIIELTKNQALLIDKVQWNEKTKT